MSDSRYEALPLRSSSAVRVTTGSRLHFGLLRTVAPFGGVGVMIQHPTTQVVVTPQPRFQCDSESAERIELIAQRFATRHAMNALPACRIEVAHRPDAHHGLGSGTQLSLAVAEALTLCFGVQDSERSIAIDVAGRGERSAVGIHGYFHGGLVFEDADASQPSSLNPIVSRQLLPTSWRVAVFTPQATIATVSGQREQQCFVHLEPCPKATSRLLQIAREQVLPAASVGEFAAFSAAVEQFNCESGLLFACVQGGAYNGPEITNLVQQLKSLGAVGVGQSSWGPSVFAWFATENDAAEFCERVPADWASGFIARVRNSPRELTLF